MRRIHRDIVGGFIFSKDAKLLFGKSRKGGVYAGTWIIPGGGIDEGETQLEALFREIMEETGIDIRNAIIEKIPGKLTGKSEKVLKDNNERVLVDMTFYNYSVRLSSNADEVNVVTEDDFVEPVWLARGEIDKIALSPPTLTTLRRLGLSL